MASAQGRLCLMQSSAHLAKQIAPMVNMCHRNVRETFLATLASVKNALHRVVKAFTCKRCVQETQRSTPVCARDAKISVALGNI